MDRPVQIRHRWIQKLAPESPFYLHPHSLFGALQCCFPDSEDVMLSGKTMTVFFLPADGSEQVGYLLLLLQRVGRLQMVLRLQSAFCLAS